MSASSSASTANQRSAGRSAVYLGYVSDGAEGSVQLLRRLV